ncbi:MAG: response regulator [Planctomycetes bacterium]|nr:response regulator [Planctomycetota bacterium]
MKTERSSTQQTEVDVSAPIVLLVDDEPNLLHALTRALRQQPYRINTARSAEEAMDILKAHRVDLIVSDEIMPGTCGSRFLSWVADNFPEVVRIILTGQPNVPSALRAINEGKVYRYFTKPCDVVELALAIRHGLEEKEVLRQAGVT